MNRPSATDRQHHSADDATAGVLVLDNPPGMTVSMRAALGQKAGIWQWCVFCKFLDLVQPHHCEATLDPDAPVPASVYWRAGVLFVGGTALFLAVVRWAVLAVF